LAKPKCNRVVQKGDPKYKMQSTGQMGRKLHAKD